jgi:cation diffusion facilitator family transporter
LLCLLGPRPSTTKKIESRVPDQSPAGEDPDPSRVALYSTVLNILVAVSKAVLAHLSGSSALLADAIHGFSDTFASLLVLLGIWFSRRKSKDFPWGLYKVENFVALVSALLIFFAGYEIAQHALKIEAGSVKHFFPSFLALSGMIGMIFLFSRYEARKARILNSPSLRADASHWYSDIASTSIVVLALLGSWIGYPLIDRLGALVMVAFIAKAGWDILKDSMRTLLDASVAPETLQQIRQAVLRFDQVREIQSLQARNSGRFIFVHAKLVFGTKKFFRAHQLSEEIERAVRREIPLVERMIIHYEPPKKDFTIQAIPVERDGKTLSDHLGEAPLFYLLQLSEPEKTLLEEKILPNPYREEEKGKGIKVSEWLLQNGVDTVYTRKPLGGKGPSYVFSSSEVEVILTDAKTIEEVDRRFRPMEPT